MPKKDATPEIEEQFHAAEDVMAAEEPTQETAEDAESTEDTMPKEVPVEEPSLDGLVKMHRHGMFMHAHPSTVENHRQNGWQLVEG